MSTLPTNIGVIIVGDEILSGKRQDKHLAKVIELLAARGLALSWARYVGDDRPRITEALQYALNSGDLVFSCGGSAPRPTITRGNAPPPPRGSRWCCTRRRRR